MIVRSMFNVIVVFITFVIAHRLVAPYPLREEFGTFKFTSPIANDQFANAFVEEVPAIIKPLPPLEKLEYIQEVPEISLKHQKDVSSAEGSVQNNKKPTGTADDNNHDKITQVQKQYKGKKGHKSAKFGEKKGHKKGHNTKGYNNRFHKDEYHKEHKLYGDAYKGNHKNTYNDAHSTHTKKDGGYGKSNKHSHGHSDNKFGKKAIDDVGTYDDSHKDFEKDSKHLKLNKHNSRLVHIKHETNPYPNHRPY